MLLLLLEEMQQERGERAQLASTKYLSIWTSRGGGERGWGSETLEWP